MWKASAEAIARARRGDGPTLIEALTFRFLGHLLGDESKYIPKQEMSDALVRDPVPKLREMLISSGVASETSLAAMETGIDREIDDALDFAISSPYADAEELARDVYAEGTLV
jgi:pyruvate dehydrogenase E1 component alpha subunit